MYKLLYYKELPQEEEMNVKVALMQCLSEQRID